MEEKRLVIKEKTNLFQKFFMKIKKMFHQKTEDNIHNIQHETLKEKIRKENAILELQKKYENGYVLEKDLEETEKQELLELYNKQIEDLEKNIVMYKKQTENYKEGIIDIRKKIAQGN